MSNDVALVLRAFPIKAEYGGGFGARVFDCAAKQSTLAPDRFQSYEQARDWAKIEAHRIMAGRVYRICSLKQSRLDQNRFYTANIYAY